MGNTFQPKITKEESKKVEDTHNGDVKNISVSDVVIYARISTPDQQSIDDQILRCKETLGKVQCSGSLKIFSDVGSGTDVTKLRELNNMYDHVKATPNCLVLVYEMSRLGRFYEVFQFVDGLCKESTVHSVSEQITIGVRQTRDFDKERAREKMYTAITFSINLSNRVKDAYRLKRKQGQYMKHVVPFGFKVLRFKRGKRIVKYLIKDPDTFSRAQRLAKRKVMKRKNETLPVHLPTHKKNWAVNMKLARIGKLVQEGRAIDDMLEGLVL